MNKLEVQKRVTRHNNPIELHTFTWNESERVFVSELDNLTLDFHDIDRVTFVTGNNCTFKTGDNCIFITAKNCRIDAGRNCVLVIESPFTVKAEKALIINRETRMLVNPPIHAYATTQYETDKRLWTGE